MTRTGRPKQPLVLGDADREVLERWARRPKSAAGVSLWARIVLACGDGLDNQTAAQHLRVHPNTVGKWRQRFIDGGCDSLYDEARSGAPRKVTDDDVEAVIVATLEETPTDATHWSTRSMAKRAGLGHSTISEIWRAFGLKPHVVDYWKLSSDPEFIDKVRDICGIYLDPPEAAMVLCVDEKSQIQALDRTAPILPILPGVPQRRSHDYLRHGTTTLFAALNAVSGEVITQTHARHRHQEFLKFLRTIDREVPDDLAIHLILDNYGTHKTPEVKKWLNKHPRFRLHFTPTYSSWMNLVERWFGELTSKRIRRGTHRSVRELEADITEWVDQWNENPRPFVWTKTADRILESIAGYLTQISRTAH